MLACEAILAAMLKATPVDEEDLKAEIKDRTAALTGDDDGSLTVHALALDLLEKSKH